jgi:hypothetical protein
MNISQFVAALEVTVCFILLLELILRLWPTYRLDYFRQNMFAVRDELFDFAAGGNISFNDPAYRLLRQSMNGFIRYAHNLTFYRFCCTFLNWKLTDDSGTLDWTAKWLNALESIKDKKLRNALMAFHGRSLYLVALRLVTGSPILMVAVLVVGVCFSAHKGWSNLREMFRNATSKLIDMRMLEEEAARS